MTLTTKPYTVTQPIEFATLTFPLPANSLVFLAARGNPAAAGPPPAVLLIENVHYINKNGQLELGSFQLAAGDMLLIVTFAS